MASTTIPRNGWILGAALRIQARLKTYIYFDFFIKRKQLSF
jgi:hypothetical protein